MPVYEGVFSRLKQNLISIKGKTITINNKFFKMIIEDFASNEDRLYKNYYKHGIDLVMSGKKRQREQDYDSEYAKQIAILEHTPVHSQTILIYKDYISEFTKIKYKLKHKFGRNSIINTILIDISKSNSRTELVNIVKEYLNLFYGFNIIIL